MNDTHQLPRLRVPWHQRARLWAALASAISTLLSLALLVWMLSPGLSSAATIRVADGAGSYAIGETSVTVTPAAGWSARDEAGGLLLVSPDRELAVRLSPVGGEGAETSAKLVGTASTETLANGFVLRHVTRVNVLTGVLIVGSETIRVEARLDHLDAPGVAKDPPDALARYRPAIAALLESIGAA